MWSVQQWVRGTLKTVIVLTVLFALGCTSTTYHPPAVATPLVDIQPEPITVMAGQSATFKVFAGGQNPFTYQWRKDGTAIVGAAASSYTIAATAVADAGLYSVLVTNVGGTVISKSVSLTVNAPPAITTQPAALALTEAQSALFSVVASGTDPLSYQWQKDGVALPGATSASYALAAVHGVHIGNYRVVVTNAFGTATSNVAALAVTLVPPTTPVISTQPAPTQTVTEAGTASFAVVATGNGLLSYQWTKSGVNLVNGAGIAGATSPNLSISNVLASAAGSYACVITNALNGTTATLTSSAAILAVNTAPTITTQPLAAQTLAQGGTATFTAAATGNGTLSYQWSKGGSSLSNGGRISGVATATLQITGLVAADTGSYACAVTNALGGTSTSTTTAASVLTINTPPLISTQPTAAQSQPQYGAASFSVSATGSGVLSYQWAKGGTALADGTSLSGSSTATLSLANLQSADAGTYACLVTNTLNGIATTTTSAGGVLTVSAPVATHLSVLSYPSPATMGSSQLFTVTALDSANNVVPGYLGTVRFTSSDAAAALPANYAFVAGDSGSRSFYATFNTLGTQSLTATDSGSAITGTQAGILVGASAPTIQTQPQTQTVMPPDAVTFNVTAKANGGGTLTYVWKKNGTAIAGATNATYQVATTEFATNTDAYSVTVSEGSLSTDSNTVYALAAVGSQTYAGDPTPIPARPLTALSSLHVDAVNYPNGAFRLGYDEALKNPVWTSYVNFPVHSPFANSTADYTADLRLAAPQVGKDDYTGIYTGGANSPDSYDRGHQVPRADVSYRYTTVAGDDATIMSNLVPQISQFNQQTWQKLEDAIGGTSGGNTDGLTSFKGRVWVYTGSVFPAAPTWWNSTVTTGLKIAIPESCYKIVIHEVTPGHPEVLAVLMPNAWGLANSTSTITNYVTSVARIEALTGLNFFPNLATIAPTLDIPTWKATVDVRGWKTPFEQVTGPNVHVLQPSYDGAVEVGTTVAFAGASTPSSAAAAGTTIASTTWNFGDATATASSLATSHVYGSTGSFSATFTASDSLGSSNTITRVIRVIPPASSNAAPTTNPVTLVPKSTTVGQPVTVTFTVADDRTLAGALVVTASSDNATLLPTSGISVANASGTVTLVLSPAAAQTGTANVTVTITDGDGSVTTRPFVLTVNPVASSILTEGFETGTKGSYVSASVTLTSSSWTLTDALLNKVAGTTDRFNGVQGIRMENKAATGPGKLTMNFDWPNGAKTVTIQYAHYGTDAAGTFGLWYSTDQGTSWVAAPETYTATPATLTTATFTVNVNQPIRCEIRRTDPVQTAGYRICFDDFVINGY